MNDIEIVLERDTANDESALVAAVFVPSGTAVAKDELVFEIENSKATEEYYAPGAGILLHELTVGQTVNFGVAIARVVAADSLGKAESLGKVESLSKIESLAKAESPDSTRSFGTAETAEKSPALAIVPPAAAPISAVTPSQPAAAPEQAMAAGEKASSAPRFSHAAKLLLQKYGIEASRFDSDFVTAEDVQAHVDCLQEITAEVLLKGDRVMAAKTAAAARATTSPVSAAVIAEPEVLTVAGSAVGQRKRAEIQALSQGAGATMLSVLGVTLGPLLVRREPGDFLAGRITDLVIYEASRLMLKYPKLNALYADGHVVTHDAVHAGLAIDDGGRLMVYGLEHTDKTGIRELGDAISDAVARYVNNSLTAAELSRATFTVTDLSDGELDFVLPLLPRGQSCILGITSSAVGGFRIFAGFDHRVTEGREVTAFLGELRDRLLSFSSTSHHVVSASLCEYCGRSVSESVSVCKERGLLKVVGRDGRETLCCGSCWNGW